MLLHGPLREVSDLGDYFFDEGPGENMSVLYALFHCFDRVSRPGTKLFKPFEPVFVIGDSFEGMSAATGRELPNRQVERLKLIDREKLSGEFKLIKMDATLPEQEILAEFFLGS